MKNKYVFRDDGAEYETAEGDKVYYEHWVEVTNKPIYCCNHVTDCYLAALEHSGNLYKIADQDIYLLEENELKSLCEEFGIDVIFLDWKGEPCGE